MKINNIKNEIYIYIMYSNKDIIPGHLITKNMRNFMFNCSVTGKNSMKLEKYQLKNIKDITKNEVIRTNLRINKYNLELKENNQPFYNSNDGFDWTENFDGNQFINNKLLLYNLKMISGEGGAQNRSLTIVSYFLETQLNYLLKNKSSHIYFINIIDGDTMFKKRNHYDNILSRYDKSILNYIFFGDLYDFKNWYLSKFNMIIND